MLSYPCELFDLRALIMLSISLVVIGLLCVYNVITWISEGCQDSRCWNLVREEFSMLYIEIYNAVVDVGMRNVGS